MIKRTIEISREPEGVHLSVRDRQLLILRRDPNEAARRLPAHPPNLVGSIPCEDIGIVMVDSRDTTYSHSALVELAEHGAAVVLSGRDHHPAAMLLPLSQNTKLLARLEDQLAMSKPTGKRLWQALVAAKIRAQAAALPWTPQHRSIRARLVAMAQSVRSGDPDNTEAQAAQVYWPLLFSRAPAVTVPFRRRPGESDAAPPNNLLDYGYAALRASVARALTAAGFLPALGIKHRGRSNPFCLADDLMEPLRPMIDMRVRTLAERADLDRLELTQPIKAELLTVLTQTVACAGQTGPLLVAIARLVSSFAAVLAGEAKALAIPTTIEQTTQGRRGTTPARPHKNRPHPDTALDDESDDPDPAPEA